MFKVKVKGSLLTQTMFFINLTNVFCCQNKSIFVPLHKTKQRQETEKKTQNKKWATSIMIFFQEERHELQRYDIKTTWLVC